LEAHLDVALKTIASERDAAIISRIWGLDGNGGASLQAIAVGLGLTRERIRQVGERAFQKLKLDRTLTAMIANVMQFTTEHMPATVAEIEAKLRQLKMISGRLGLTSVMIAAEAFKIDVPFAATPVGTDSIVHDARIPSLRPLKSAARVLTARHGAMQVREVMRRAAIADRRLGRLDLAGVVLPCCEGFRWLDESSGWFFLLSTSGNHILQQIRKVLSVVDEIAVADLKDAVRRDHKTFRLELPDTVFYELCRQTPWLSVEGQMIRSRIAIPSNHALSKTERGLSSMLRDAGTALSPSYIVSRCAAYKINPGTVLQDLLFSSIIRKYGHARYGLVGLPQERIISKERWQG
jgi:hypothetical protein